MEELKEGWKIVKLGEVAEYISNKINTSELNENNYISTENMIVNRGGVTKATNIPQNAKVNCFSENDILFSNIRTYFKKLWKADFNGGASNDVLIIRSLNSKNILNDYLYYIMSEEKFFDYTVNTSKGTKMPRGDKTAIMQYEFYIPEDIKVQQKIASILSSLDDKIEINNEMNKTLEDMAQTLFKRWFIDFDFSNENGEPYRSSGGKMVDSELGEIPEGWEVKKLSEVCNIEKGLSYKGKHLCEKGIPMVNLGSVQPGGGYREEKIKFYNGDFKPRNIVKAGDIIIANTDMTQERVILGSPFIVPKFLGNSVIFTHHLYSITNMKLPSTFLYCYFQEKKFREMCESCATGTTVLALPKNDVLNILIMVPKKEILDSFDNIVKNFFNLMELRLDEIRDVTQLRDTLLPKLMSGEVEI
ncbi:MAG: restriction endonuclease subunit S [Aeromonas sp.]